MNTFICNNFLFKYSDLYSKHLTKRNWKKDICMGFFLTGKNLQNVWKMNRCFQSYISAFGTHSQVHMEKSSHLPTLKLRDEISPPITILRSFILVKWYLTRRGVGSLVGG